MRPIALSDTQMAALTDAAAAVPYEKRNLFLLRVESLMQFRGRSDADFRDALELASAGLVQRQSARRDGQAQAASD